MAEDPVVEVARITIIRELGSDDDAVSVSVDPDSTPLMSALGMLRMAEYTIIEAYAERNG